MTKYSISSNELELYYADSYESALGEVLATIPPEKREEADDMVMTFVLEDMAERIANACDVSRDAFSLGGAFVFHPQEYNFYTDNVEFDLVDYDGKVLAACRAYALENSEAFAAFLAANYTPRDGFLPWVPCDVAAFWQELTIGQYEASERAYYRSEWRISRCFAALLRFVLEDTANGCADDWYDSTVWYMLEPLDALVPCDYERDGIRVSLELDEVSNDWATWFYLLQWERDGKQHRATIPYDGTDEDAEHGAFWLWSCIRWGYRDFTEEEF